MGLMEYNGRKYAADYFDSEDYPESWVMTI